MFDLVKADRASLLHNELIDLTESATHHFFRMGEIMKEIRDDELWRTMGYESFESYFSDPELDFKKSTVYHAIRLIEIFRDRKELETIPVSKLIMVAPYITDKNTDELLGMARALSRGDLEHELSLRKLGYSTYDTAPIPKIYHCKNCGKVRGVVWADLCHCGMTGEEVKNVGRFIEKEKKN